MFGEMNTALQLSCIRSNLIISKTEKRERRKYIESKTCSYFFTASVRNIFRSDEYLMRGAETPAGLRVVSFLVFQSRTELDTFR
jgi:hypothetical protein